MKETSSFRFELKSIDANQFEGHGAIFGNRDLGNDIIVPGAFRATLAAHRSAKSMPLMFWMHQPDQVPGVWLNMEEDDVGLHVKGEIVDTALGRDVHKLIQKKAVRGLSMGYQAIEVAWNRDGERVLKEVELFEVSIVSMAMNPLARVEAVKARLSANGEYVPTERELEQEFRRLGCSKSVARLMTARVFEGANAGGMPGSSRWDAGDADDDEDKQLLAAISALTDRIGAQALPRL